MKTAIKVLSILGLVLMGIVLLVLFIVTFNVQNMIQYAFDEGSLYNGHQLVTSQAEVNTIKSIAFAGLMIADCVLVGFTALPIINLATAESDNKVLHLVLGILDILTGLFIVVGIVQILVYAGVEENKTTTLGNN